MRKEQLDAGENTANVDRAIEKYSSLYNVAEADLKDFREQAEEGNFKFVTKQMSPDDVEKILKVATDAEKPEIEAILKKKQENAAKKAEREKPKPLSEQLNKANTDKAVELWDEYKDKLDEKQKKDFINKLRQKAAKSQGAGTLTQEEIDNIKKVISDIQLKPSSRPVRPKRPGLQSLKDVF